MLLEETDIPHVLVEHELVFEDAGGWQSAVSVAEDGNKAKSDSCVVLLRGSDTRGAKVTADRFTEAQDRLVTRLAVKVQDEVVTRLVAPSFANKGGGKGVEPCLSNIV